MTFSRVIPWLNESARKPGERKKEIILRCIGIDPKRHSNPQVHRKYVSRMFPSHHCVFAKTRPQSCRRQDRLIHRWQIYLDLGNYMKVVPVMKLTYQYSPKLIYFPVVRRKSCTDQSLTITTLFILGHCLCFFSSPTDQVSCKLSPRKALRTYIYFSDRSLWLVYFF